MLEDLPIGRRSAAWRRSQGMAFVPEERLGRGAVPELSLAQNILLSHQDGATVRHGFVRQAAIRNLAAGILERFRVSAVGSWEPAASLSGGNLHKYIIGRAVARKTTVLHVAQPTRGGDVGGDAQHRAEL